MTLVAEELKNSNPGSPAQVSAWRSSCESGGDQQLLVQVQGQVQGQGQVQVQVQV